MSAADTSKSPDVAPPSADAIREAVERILASPDFAASDRASRFLRYVVEETLAGRSDRIKAFSVAIEVFDRDETFDPQNDPVVRIEAGRLRRRLEHYYVLDGEADPIVIDIPKGGYIPTFKWRPDGVSTVAQKAPAYTAEMPATGNTGTARWRPIAVALSSIVLVAVALLYTAGIPPFRSDPPALGSDGPRIIVLPFVDLGQGEISALYSAALIDDIITNLGHHEQITVLGVQTSRAAGADADLATLHGDYAVQYALEGSVRIEGERVRVTARLVDATDGAVVWSQGYENALTPADLIEIQIRTAEEVATALAEPHGIVFEAELARDMRASSGDLSGYLCTLRYYDYRSGPSAEKHAEVRNCLEQAIVQFPEYATAWALLANLYIDEDRYGFNQQAAPRSRALENAREASRLEPQNARAMQALMMALYFNQNADEALRVGERALDLNPNDPELQGQLGMITAMAGSADRGRTLLEMALARNPRNSGYYHGILGMSAYMAGDYERALAEMEQVDKRKVPIYSHLIAAMTYAQTGRDNQARSELAEFQRRAPDWIPNLWAELDKRSIPEERQRRIVDGLTKAGATIPPNPGSPTENAAATDRQLQ